MSGDAKQEQLENRKFNEQLFNGLAALEKQDFNAYMQVLVTLGAAMQNRLGITSKDIKKVLAIKDAKDITVEDKQFLLDYKANKSKEKIAKEMAEIVRGQGSLSFSQKLSFTGFKSAWEDKEIEDVWEENQRKNAAAKAEEAKQKKAEEQKKTEENAGGSPATTISLSPESSEYSARSPSPEDESKQDFEGGNNPLGKQVVHSKIKGQHLKAKYPLSKETRTQVKLGLMAFEHFLARMQLDPASVNSVPENSTLAKIDEQAVAAISGYKTKTQTWFQQRLGVALGVITSFSFGAIETGVAIVGLLIAVSNPLIPALFAGSMALIAATSILMDDSKAGERKWPKLLACALFPVAIGLLALTTGPLVVAVVLAGIVGTTATWVNWLTFRHYLSQLLQDIAGKNKWLDGLTEVTDPESGEKRDLGTGKKVGLGLFAALAALPTGAAIGTLLYVAISAIPELFVITGIAGSIFPPLGIVLGAIAAIAMTMMLTKSLYNLLQEKDVVAALKKPFQDVAKMLNDQLDKPEISPIRRVVTKGLTYLAVGLLAIAGLAGLVVTCIGCKSTLSTFVTKTFNAAPVVAAGIGIAVGGVAAFISRAYFTFKGAVVSGVTFCKQFVSGKKNQVDSQDAMAVGVEAVACVTFFAWALGGLKGALLSLLTGVRSWANDYSHVVKQEKSPQAVMKDTASTTRVARLLSLRYEGNYLEILPTEYKGKHVEDLPTEYVGSNNRPRKFDGIMWALKTNTTQVSDKSCNDEQKSSLVA